MTGAFEDRNLCTTTQAVVAGLSIWVTSILAFAVFQVF